MRKLLPLLLAVAACNDAPPFEPSTDLSGTWRLESVSYRNPVVVQGCPCEAPFRFVFEDGLIGTNGLAIEITSMRRSDGFSQVLYAYTADGGQYVVQGDSVHVIATIGNYVVPWMSGAYSIEGGSLIRYVETPLDTLEAVWVRE